MTGFGRAERHDSEIFVSVEIRSVNNRFMKLALTLPEALRAFESRIERRIKERLRRGSIAASIRFDSIETKALARLDREVIECYVAALSELGSRLGVAPLTSLAELLELPGAQMEPEAALCPESTADAVIATLDEALERVCQERASEGLHLERFLRERLEVMGGLLAKIRVRAAGVPGEIAARLRARIDALLGAEVDSVDSASLAREVALLADRADVTEEVDRFGAHLARFAEILADERSGGRELDFLAQEMLREANTIASKSVNREMIHEIVTIKSEIEKLKEQIQNVE